MNSLCVTYFTNKLLFFNAKSSGVQEVAERGAERAGLEEVFLRIGLDLDEGTDVPPEQLLHLHDVIIVDPAQFCAGLLFVPQRESRAINGLDEVFNELKSGMVLATH